ncbi:MAG: peptide chain release factor N(5)-glutamine methyltransferase [Ruminococcus sp.]|nr:peptide chain release factor N(5)-glutamine methyltransferase [Ruminococcus sp.]
MYAQLLKNAVSGFESKGVEDARNNARELLAKALGCSCRDAAFEQRLSEQAQTDAANEFEELCKRRMNGEPLQYLIGEWEFYGLTFKVGRGVLIPRQDTETLIDTVLKKADRDKKVTVVDLCAGSGCIGIVLEKYLNCEKVFAVELSDEAMAYLEENIRLNKSGVVAVKGDVTDRKTADALPMADILVSNPPYLTAQDMRELQTEVTFEPESALFGGEDGLDIYRQILINFKHRLKQGGLAVFEIGAGMEEDVMTMLVRHGFENVRAVKDACGIFRCVAGFKK